MRAFLAGIAILLAVAALAACGGGDDPETAQPEAETGPCSEIEEIEVGPVEHADTDFAAADYATNPPTGGDHNDGALQPGMFYNDPPRLGEAVHFLEHGAVIGWTNNLSPEGQKAVEDEFNDVFGEGYYQLATVENPDLEVPFALSAWGAMQNCEELDTSVIRPFIEDWYASPKSPESSLACSGPARKLPPC
jgi:Protein of unknown function (DUF3105)